MELQQIIDKSHRIVFFGGAGVSTESGIPDFRSVDGLYNQKYDYPPEQILSLSSVITQNIDGLHTAAGSKKVLELHGSVHRNYCMDCGKFYTAEDILNSTGIPKCTCGGTIKPDVVLYEEGLDDKTVTEAVREISQCDTLIIAGTSLTVYPAAGMVRYFQGDNLVLINRDKTSMDGSCDLVIHDKVGETLDKIVIKQR